MEKRSCNTSVTVTDASAERHFRYGNGITITYPDGRRENYEERPFQAYEPKDKPKDQKAGCILTNFKCPLMMEEKKREILGMSLVGISFVNGKFIAYGDSKASRVIAQGTSAEGEPYAKAWEDSKRGHIRKVFKNGDFIIACCGLNEYVIPSENGTTCMWIEEWITENIHAYKEPSDFSVALMNAISDGVSEKYPINTTVIFGRKRTINGKQYGFCGTIEINVGFMDYNEHTVLDGYRCLGGDMAYRQYFDFFPDALLTDDHALLRQQLELAVEYFQKYKLGGKYNPVGGPFFIEEL